MEVQPRSPGRPRMVEVGGRVLALTEYSGEGPPVVVLHGIGSRDVSWWPVIDGLTPWFHLYVVDLRGHGASAKPENGYDVADYADDLQGLLDALALSRPRIIGHSLGALVILAWSALHPERAAALVLEDPPLRVYASVLDLFDGWIDLAARPVEQVMAYYGETYPEWSEAERLRRALSLTGTAPAVFAEGRERFARLLAAHGEHLPPVSDQLPPTLLIYGDVAAGGMLAVADADWFTATVPRGEAVQIPGAGHSVHRERPAEFLALAVPFLRAAT